MRVKQVQLPGFDFKTAKPFGGPGPRGCASHAKTARPFHSKMAMHVVLKSSRARDKTSLLFHAKTIEKILRNQSQIFGVKLYQSANAGNHLHLVIRARSRRALRGYLRAISGIIAKKALGVQRGAGRTKRSHSKSRAPGFWDARPFSRLVTWGRDYARIRNYLQINRNEMTGIHRLSARAMLTRIAEFQRSTGLVSVGFGTG